MIAVYTCLTKQHDLILVALAGVICLVSTTIGVDLLARGRRPSQAGYGRWVLLFLSSLVCSTGVWATHFLSMLAYDVGVPIGFALLPTVASVAIGIVTIGLGFALITGTARWWRIAASGVIIGCGVGLLHYEGMAGLVLPNRIGWNSALIEASIGGGILWSILAIALIVHGKGLGSRVGAAVAFSLGVISLHFTGMAAISILPELVPDTIGAPFPHQTIAIAITVGVSVIATVALITSIADQIVVRRSVEEAGRLSKINDDLARAKDLAEAANRAKSKFLAMMSHEIRTPLTGMLGMIDLLAEASSASERRRYIALARESADNLLAVVNGVLDFSQLEADKLQTESIDFEPARLLFSTTELFRASAAGKDIRLEALASSDLPLWLSGDPHRIRQILSNLLSNALKFTAAGVVEVSASHRVVEDERIELRIEVTDSGVGIASHARDRLFEPFVQADSSMSRRYGGSGLGLSICKRLCELLNGDIGVGQGPDGVGSRFWFTVRCGAGRAVLPQPASPAHVAHAPLSVLVAEDTPIVSTLVRSLLVREGYHPTMVANGAEALAMVGSGDFDLVLMDIQMPEMDGVTAARAIRGLRGPVAAIPIIALTANVSMHDRNAYRAAGITDCVTKPIRPAELFRSIRSCTVAQRSEIAPSQA